jgi:hypothetical protein
VVNLVWHAKNYLARSLFAADDGHIRKGSSDL